MSPLRPNLSVSCFHKRFRCCECSSRTKELRHFSSIRLRLVLIYQRLYNIVDFLFKALAQDQKAALEGLLACCRGLESTFVRKLIVFCLRFSEVN